MAVLDFSNALFSVFYRFILESNLTSLEVIKMHLYKRIQLCFYLSFLVIISFVVVIFICK